MPYLRLSQIANSPVYPGLQKVHLGKHHLVVQSLELRKESLDQSKCRLVLLRVQLSTYAV